MQKRHLLRQLDLLPPDEPTAVAPALPTEPLQTVREALQRLLMDVVVGERLQKEVRDEQDHA